MQPINKVSGNSNKINSKTVVTVFAGVLLIGGGVCGLIYLKNKSKEVKAAQVEKERQKSSVKQVLQGRGNLSGTAGVVAGRGIDGISFS